MSEHTPVSTLNVSSDGTPWLTNKQFQDLQDQILRQLHRTLLKANEAIQKLLFKAQLDVNVCRIHTRRFSSNNP